METRDTLFAVDVENLYISLQRKRGRALDMAEAITSAGGWNRVLEVRAYGDFSNLPPTLLQELEAHPITRNNVRTRTRMGVRIKDAIDFELAADLLDVVFTRPDIRRIVLGAGDRHYLPALARVRREGRAIEVAAIEGSLSADVERFVGCENVHNLHGGRELEPVGALIDRE
jgi:uncharacterized LabA/DUF88 family protein